MDSLEECLFFVEAESEEARVLPDNKGEDENIEGGEEVEIFRGCPEEVTEEEMEDIAVVAWGYGEEDDANGHSGGPERSDDGVLSLFVVEVDPTDEQRGEERSSEGAEKWGCP